MKSGNLNFLEPSGPVLACNGAALHVYYIEFVGGPVDGSFKILLLLLLLLLLKTSIELSLGGSSPSVVQTKQIRINVHKQDNTKTRHKQYKTEYTYYQNTHTLKTPTHARPHITNK